MGRFHNIPAIETGDEDWGWCKALRPTYRIGFATSMVINGICHWWMRKKMSVMKIDKSEYAMSLGHD